MTVEALFDALTRALDIYEPGWTDEIEEDEVFAWAQARWPVTPADLLHIDVWARSCYHELLDEPRPRVFA